MCLSCVYFYCIYPSPVVLSKHEQNRKERRRRKGERPPFSSPAPQRCQNYHIVCGSAGEHSCSTERLLLSHTGGRGERETQEERQESGVEKEN